MPRKKTMTFRLWEVTGTRVTAFATGYDTRRFTNKHEAKRWAKGLIRPTIRRLSKWENETL